MRHRARVLIGRLKPARKPYITSVKQRLVALFFVLVMLASALIPSAQVYAEAAARPDDDKPMATDYPDALPVKTDTNKPAADYSPQATANLPGGLSAVNSRDQQLALVSDGFQASNGNKQAFQVGEIMSKRQRDSQTFRRQDGKLTIKQYTNSQFYQKDGSWQNIDLSLIEDKNSGDAGNALSEGFGLAQSLVSAPDAYQVKGNEWTARFAPSGSQQAMVRIKRGQQQMGFSPLGAKAGVAPVITSDDQGRQTVHYYDLWPGVNVEYEVRADELKENIIAKDKSATNNYRFAMTGAVLKQRAQKPGELLPAYDVESEGELKDEFVIAPFGVVLNTYGPEDAKGALQHSFQDGVLNISLDRQYMENLPADAYPLTVDPTVSRTIIGTRAGGNYASYKSDGYACPSNICNPYAGSVKDTNGIWRNWRGIMHANYSAAKGKQINSAKWVLKQRTGLPVTGDTGVRTISMWHAACFGFECLGSPVGSVSMATSGEINATSFYQARQAANDWGSWVMLSGQENVATTTYKNIDPGNGDPNVEGSYLELVVTDILPAPTVVTPVDGQVFVDPQVSFSATGGLTNPSNGGALQYQFCVSTSLSCGGAVMVSGTQASPQWVIAEDVLQDGVTYYVQARTYDPAPAVQTYSTYGSSKSFRLDSRSGKDSTQSYDTLGPVSVDLATGNVTASAASHSSAALGGSMGISLDYNSPLKSRQGLVGQYWNNDTLSGNPVLKRVDQNVRFTWGAGSPAGSVPNDNFSARWEGYFVAPKAGSYQFGSDVDDGCRIWVDNQPKLDNWTWCGTQYGTAITLDAGQVVPIKMEYREVGGSATAALMVKGAVPEQAVPTAWLQTGVRKVAQSNGLTGRYFRDPQFTKDFAGMGVEFMMQRTDPLLSFDWGVQPAVPGGPADNFLVRWTGYITAPATDTYTFGANHDDGVRVRMGTANTTVLDEWHDHSGTVEWGANGYAMTAGVPVPITVEFYENTGGASLSLQVKSAAMAAQVVPSSWLSPGANVLPDGWNMGVDPDGSLSYDRLKATPNSVILTDSTGSTHEYTATPGANSYKPPVNEDGKLSRNDDGSYTLQDTDGRTYVFKADGTLESVTAPTDDKQPAALKYQYGGTPARLTQVTDGVTDGRWAKVFYYGDSDCAVPPVSFDAAAATSGKLCAVKTDDGRITNIFYKNGNLARIAEPGDELTDLQYDALGRISAVRDVAANDAVAAGVRADDTSVLTEITYDDIGRAKAVKQPAASAGAGRTEHTVGYGSYGPGQWSGTQSLTGPATSPVAISWGGERVDLFARGAAGDLVHQWTEDGQTWSAWESLGGCIRENPTVASWAPGRLDVIAQGCNDTGSNTFQRAYTNGQWYPWYNIPNPNRINGSPSAVSWGPERIDYVLRGTNNELYHGYWSAASGWQVDPSFGGCLSGSPAIASSAPAKLEVTTVNCAATGDNLASYNFTGASWQGYVAMPGVRLSTVSSAYDRLGGLVLAGRDSANVLRYKLGGGAWQSGTGCVTDTPSAFGYAGIGFSLAYATCADGWKTERYGYTGYTEQYVTGSSQPHGYSRRVEYDKLLRTVKDYDIAALADVTEWHPQKDLVLSTTDETGLKSTTIYDDDDRAINSYGPAPAAWYGADRKPLPAYASQVPRSDTAYDEGITGTHVSYYSYGQASRSLIGAPKLRSTNLFGAAAGDFAKTYATTPVTGSNDWGLRATGKFRFPAAGQWNFRVKSDDGIRLYIDDVLEIDDWNSGPDRDHPVRGITVAANSLHKFRLDYYHAVDASSTDNASIELCLTPPGAAETCTGINQYFTPDYDLATSNKVYDSTIGDVISVTNYGTNPELGLPQSATIDPTGLNLTSAMAYEQQGAAGSYLRQTSKTLPGNSPTNPAFNYTYYGATETRDNPCTVAVEGYRQAGFMKVKAEADPDGPSSGGGGNGAAPVVQTSSSGTVASGALNLSKPTGTANGDLLIMTASADLELNENVTYSIPTGWTQVLTNTRTGATNAGNNLQVWYKLANNEPASYAITPDHDNRIGGSVLRITGQAASDFIKQQAVTAIETGEAAAPSVTTTSDNNLILRVMTWDQSKTVTTAPAGHTQAYHVDITGHDNWGGHKVQTTAGSTGVAQFDLSGGAPYVGFTLAIAPNSSVATGTQTGRATETIYDDAGRTVAARMNNDPWTCTTYDNRGRATQTVVPTINGRQGRTLTTNYAYQGSPLKSRVEDSVAGNTVQEADLLGRSVAGTDQFGNTSSVAYDTFGRVSSRTSPAGAESYTYDMYNRMATYVFNGVTYATVTYDNLSRVQDITYNEAKQTAGGGSGSAPVVQSSTSGTVSSGNLALAKPTGTTTGDLLVMTASADLDASENVTYTIPSGWTQLLANTRSDATSAGNNLQVWYKQATSSEPADYAIAPDHSNRIGGSITRITGHDSSNPIDVQAVTVSLTGEASAPSVTTTAANTQLLRIATWDQSRSLVTNPSGHTQTYSVDVSGHDNWGVYKEQATAGATGAAQWDLSGAAPYVGFTVAIKPAASGGGTTSDPMKLEQIKRDSLLRTNGAVFRFSDNKTFDETVTMSQSSKVTAYTDLFNSISANNSYAYDKAGRLLEATIDNLKHAYGYNAPNSTTCNQASANPVAHKNSNRTSYTRTNLTTSQTQASQTYCYDQVDRLLSASDPHIGTPAYDDHGNTTSFAGNGTPIQLAYDASDQNVSIQQGNNRVEYLKTASGAVLRKKEYNGSALTKSYRYLNGGAILQSCSLADDNSCTTSDTYLGLPGSVTLTLSPTNPDTAKRTVYSLKNFHGDTAMTATGAGVASSTVYLYEPYGQPSASQTFGTNSDLSNATNLPMGWAADPTRKQESLFSTAIIQMGARVYLPSIGRFAQADPVSGGNVNSYVYAADPINFSDYTGMFLQGGAGAFFLQPAVAAPRVQNAAGARTVYTARRIAIAKAPARAAGPPPRPPVKASAPKPVPVPNPDVRWLVEVNKPNLNKSNIHSKPAPPSSNPFTSEYRDLWMPAAGAVGGCLIGAVGLATLGPPGMLFGCGTVGLTGLKVGESSAKTLETIDGVNRLHNDIKD